MADLIYTPDDVNPLTGTQSSDGVAGVSIVEGNAIYSDSDGLLQLSDCSTVATAKIVGIAITAGGVGNKINYTRIGTITFGTLTIAVNMWVVSRNPGKIMPVGDLVSTEWLVQVGIGKGTADGAFLVVPKLHFQLS